MSEASDNDDASSSDEENGLFGNMMKTMFKENDMKKEFIYQYNIRIYGHLCKHWKR